MTILQVVLIAGVVGFLAWAVRPRPVFKLTIREGKAVDIKGKPPSEFVYDCEQICRQTNLPKVVVKVFRRGKGMSVTVSSSVPKLLHQRFRNAWQFHG